MKATAFDSFYFQVISDPTQILPHFFFITPCKYYDEHGCLSDESEIIDEILPMGFVELAASTFEFLGTHERGKQILIDLGLKEINFGLDAVEPTDRTDEDEEFEEAPEEDELDIMLKQDDTKSSPSLDYSNLPTSQLERHLKAMLQSESFREAQKIKDELDSRTELNKQ